MSIPAAQCNPGPEYMLCERMRCTLRVSVCARRQTATDWDGSPLFLECWDCPDGIRIRNRWILEGNTRRAVGPVGPYTFDACQLQG